MSKEVPKTRKETQDLLTRLLDWCHVRYLSGWFKTYSSDYDSYNCYFAPKEAPRSRFLLSMKWPVDSDAGRPFVTVSVCTRYGCFVYDCLNLQELTEEALARSIQKGLARVY